jgi:putative endonuclease
MAAKDVLGRHGEDLAATYLEQRAVDRRKAARIRRVTQAWLAAHQVRWCEIRFDVLAVVAEPGKPVTVRHYEAAF